MARGLYISVKNMIVSPIVIDTNIVLDCFVFKDPAAQRLREQIVSAEIRWIATPAMIEEYLRVLTYPNVARRALLLDEKAYALLPRIFMLYANIVDVPSKDQIPCVICRDKDDQIFIDLALAYQGVLVSKDHEVLKLHGKKGLRVKNVENFFIERGSLCN